MGVFGRIGNIFRSAASRVGTFNFASALNRVSGIASAGHKLGSLVDSVTGGGLTSASNAVLGTGPTQALKNGSKYLARAYDTALMVRATAGNNISGVPSTANGVSGGGYIPQGKVS